MIYRITHVDHHGRRHQLDMEARSRSVAEQLAELIYGSARYLACICLRRRS
jgi:hypothetical protein